MKNSKEIMESRQHFLQCRAQTQPASLILPVAGMLGGGGVERGDPPLYQMQLAYIQSCTMSLFLISPVCCGGLLRYKKGLWEAAQLLYLFLFYTSLEKADLNDEINKELYTIFFLKQQQLFSYFCSFYRLFIIHFTRLCSYDCCYIQMQAYILLLANWIMNDRGGNIKQEKSKCDLWQHPVHTVNKKTKWPF